jgi:molybdopterin-guanine dinucleotide biosynthesis adapter protein
MRVAGFCGPSGSGKTTLIERLLPLLRAQSLRVSVIKHAHSGFDIDRAGKDSWRHREAGAFEVLLASDRRIAKLREFDAPMEPSVHQLLAELHECDWVLIEGFKQASVCKFEFVAPQSDRPPLYPDDPYVVALVTDAPENLPVPTQLPVFGRDQVEALAQFLLAQSARHDYDGAP